MNKTEVKTNWHWREPLSWHQLTEKEQKEFDYIENPEYSGWNRFTRYCGNVIDLRDMMRLHDPNFDLNPDKGNPLHKWHAYASDSFFSGIVIRYDEDCELFQIGTYIAS